MREFHQCSAFWKTTLLIISIDLTIFELYDMFCMMKHCMESI